MARYQRGFNIHQAIDGLISCDPTFMPWIKRIGLIEVGSWAKRFNTTDALARAILHQQLSGKAAATIIARVEKAVSSKVINHRSLVRVDDATLRLCGVSGNKALALRDLAARSACGEIPNSSRLSGLSDQEIIELLTKVRGIGRWTVEMLLMFRLGRPDVLPADDLGIRKGLQILDSLSEVPTAKMMAIRGMSWAPYRTIAGLYLWRIADFVEQPEK